MSTVTWRYRIDIEDPPATDAEVGGRSTLEDTILTISQMCNAHEDDWVGMPDEPCLDGVELPLDPKTLWTVITEALGRKRLVEFGHLKITVKRVETHDAQTLMISPGDVPNFPDKPEPANAGDFPPEDPVRMRATQLLYQLECSSQAKSAAVRTSMARLRRALGPKVLPARAAGLLYCDTNACGDISCHRCFPFPGCTMHEKCLDPASHAEEED